MTTKQVSKYCHSKTSPSWVVQPARGELEQLAVKGSSEQQGPWSQKELDSNPSSAPFQRCEQDK